MNKVYYRNLRRYKYQLMHPYYLTIGIKGYVVDTPYLKLDKCGNLEISKGYAWDGPSGPTIDTLNFMRGSLVHDALYQLIRIEEIPPHYKELGVTQLNHNQLICLDANGCVAQFASYKIRQLKINCVTPKNMLICC